MNRGTLRWAGILIALLAAWSPALPCSLCNPGKASTTLRQETRTAKLVLFGQLANARMSAANDGGGTTDFQIEKVLKTDPWLGDKKVVEIQRYVRIEPSNPHFILYCDVFKGKLDAYRGEPASAQVVDYLQKAMALDSSDRIKALLFYFDYLDHRDQKVSTDAYLEFSRASDAEIGQVAGKLSADKLRNWLQDPKTPAYRLALYGFLLGACGGDRDAALLRSMLERTSERTAGAVGGLLSGYIRLRPREGWDLAQVMLQDTQRSFTERYAIIGTLRFYHGWKPEETRDEVLRCLGLLISQGEMADIAVEDLRRWETWTLTEDILSQFGKKTHAAPIVRRAIVRYALCCPQPQAQRFVALLRKQDPKLVGDVEESLQFEKQK